MKGTHLGELEELVLLVIVNLDRDAYGLSIRNFIREKCNRSVSLSTVHSTIHRLENKGFLRSKYSSAEAPERGGRPKLLFTITSSGSEAIKSIQELRNTLWKTIPNLAFVQKIS